MSWHNVDPIPFEQLADFVRKVTHDVRNGINAIDLQTALLAEIAADAEMKEEIKRLRGMVPNVTRSLASLSRYFQEPQPETFPCPADILLENLRNRVTAAHPKQAADVHWPATPGTTEAMVDVERFTEAMLEIFRNASDFRANNNPISVTTAVENGCLVVEVREEKPAPELPPEEWPHRFLRSTRRAGYGLGIFRAKAALAAQNATLNQSYDGTCVVSRVTLPFAADGR